MYTVKHDGDDWPSDLDPTVSTHADLEDAVRALELAFDRHARQLSAAGETGAVLSLTVVDDTGRELVSAASNATSPGTVRFTFADADADASSWPPLP